MRNPLNLPRVCTLIGVTVFIIAVTSYVQGQTADKTVAAAVANSSAAAPAAKAQPSQPHSVTLSWTASVPKSASPGDAITGYKVYRSTAPAPVLHRKADEIPCSFVSTTKCVDSNVVPGQTYTYAVSAWAGHETNDSTLSLPVTVTIPAP